jgi:hypothetical protein
MAGPGGPGLDSECAQVGPKCAPLMCPRPRAGCRQNSGPLARAVIGLAPAATARVGRPSDTPSGI